MATIFDALTTQIKTLTTVTALVGDRIRPLKLAQKDDLTAPPNGVGGPSLLISPVQNVAQNDLSARGGAKSLSVLFRCVAETLADAQAVSDAVEWNGTNPGSGMAGLGQINVLGIFIQRISIDMDTYDFIFYEDGSDEGYYVVDKHSTVDYTTFA